MEQHRATGSKMPSRRLLIVDDDQKFGHVLAEYFSTKGYEVRVVLRGEEALALVSVFQPHVVLLDLLMPKMSGIDTLKRLKRLSPTTKVIMLSSADLEEVAQGALQLGVHAYVCKPPNLSELEHLVSGVWPSRES